MRLDYSPADRWLWANRLIRKLLLLCPILLILEIVILAWITAHTSFAVTAGIVLGSGLLGIALIRWQGTAISRQAIGEMAQGRSPAEHLLSRALILFAGVLLITPGVLADLAGLALLVPPVRQLIQRRIAAAVEARISFHSFGAHGTQEDSDEGDIIDAEAVRPASSARLNGHD